MFVCLHSPVSSNTCKYWVIPIPWCIWREVGQQECEGWGGRWPWSVFMWRDHICGPLWTLGVPLWFRLSTTFFCLFVTFHVAPPAGVKSINNCRMNHHSASTYHFGDVPTCNYHWRHRSVSLVYVWNCLFFFTVTITAAQIRLSFLNINHIFNCLPFTIF